MLVYGIAVFVGTRINVRDGGRIQNCEFVRDVETRLLADVQAGRLV
jgi:hypothetical protein